MNKIVYFLWLLLYQYGAAQEVININGVDCGVHGSAKYNSRVYELNELKNRYQFPRPSDYDSTITLQRLTKASEYAFSSNKAAMVTGYVYNVKVGGVESCNCRTKDRDFMDTHIELTVSRDKTSPQYRVIAEVTPRLRAIMADKGVDWSTTTLKKALVGHTVKIGGWLLYDGEHSTEDFADDPGDSRGGNNWRATGWEIHPITYIKVLGNTTSFDGTVNSPEPTIPSNNTTVPETHTATGINYFIWGFVVAVLLILLFSYFKKK